MKIRTMVTCASLTFAVPSMAQDACVDYLDFASPMAVHRFASGPSSVEDQGDLIYCSAKPLQESGWGLVVLDLSDPMRPEEIGFLELDGAGRIEIVDDVAWVMLQRSGLARVDVRDPAVPVLLETFSYPYILGDLASRGTQLYLSSEDSLHVIDANNPSMRFALPVDGFWWELSVVDAYLYGLVLGTEVGRVSLDSVETNPEIEVLELPNPQSIELASDFVVRGDEVLVTSWYERSFTDYIGRQFVFDWGAPTPVLLGEEEVSAFGIRRELVGSRVFGSNGSWFDWPESGDPGPISYLSTIDRGFEVRAMEDYLLYFDGLLRDRLLVVPLASMVLDPVPRLASLPLDLVEPFHVGHDRAYRTSEDGLRVLDLRDPTAPEEILALDMGGRIYNLGVDETIRFTFGPELHIVRRTQGDGPQLVTSFNPNPGKEWQLRDHVQNGNYLYVSGTDFGDFPEPDVHWLQVFRLEEDAAPTLTDSIHVDVRLDEMVVYGGHVYAVSSRKSGVAWIDVFDPFEISLAGWSEPVVDENAWRWVGIDGDTLVVGDDGGWLETYFVGGGSPQLVNSLPLSSGLSSFDLVGDYAYIQAIDDVVRVFDVTTGAEVAYYSPSSDRLTHLSVGPAGILEYRPSLLTVRALPCGGQVEVPVAQLDFTVLREGDVVRLQWRLSDPGQDVSLFRESDGNIRQLSFARDSAGRCLATDPLPSPDLRSRIAYSLRSADHAILARVLLPQERTLRRATIETVAPNPFNPQTEIVVHAPTRERLSVRIIDQRGRNVVELFDGVPESRVLRLNWDASGVPSGVYHVTLRSEGSRSSRKIALLK